MPCIRDDNGLPVPGSKGSCPIGSTWSDSNMVNLVQSQADRITGQEAVAGEEKTVEPRDSLTPLKFMSNWKDYFMRGLGGTPQDASTLISGQPTPMSAAVSSPTYKGGRQARGDREPPRELSKWEQLSANFKDPEWWMKSMSGLPHDTRLHRLGMLMDYYGRTPKGRAAVDMPAEVWAKNEQEALKNRAAVLAAQAKNNPSFLSKMSSEDQDLAIRETIKDKLGFSDWIPFNEASDEDLEQTIAMVKGLIQQYVQEGDSWTEAYKKAMNQVEK